MRALVQEACMATRGSNTVVLGIHSFLFLFLFLFFFERADQERVRRGVAGRSMDGGTGNGVAVGSD